MFGLFKNPECPQCGRETTPTGYCFPHVSHRCVPCVNQSSKEEELNRRIEKLEKIIKEKK